MGLAVRLPSSGEELAQDKYIYFQMPLLCKDKFYFLAPYSAKSLPVVYSYQIFKGTFKRSLGHVGVGGGGTVVLVLQASTMHV